MNGFVYIVYLLVLSISFTCGWCEPAETPVRKVLYELTTFTISYHPEALLIIISSSEPFIES